MKRKNPPAIAGGTDKNDMEADEAALRKKLPDGTRESIDEEEMEERARYYRDWKERMMSWQPISRSIMGK